MYLHVDYQFVICSNKYPHFCCAVQALQGEIDPVWSEGYSLLEHI